MPLALCPSSVNSVSGWNDLFPYLIRQFLSQGIKRSTFALLFRAKHRESDSSGKTGDFKPFDLLLGGLEKRPARRSFGRSAGMHPKVAANGVQAQRGPHSRCFETSLPPRGDTLLVSDVDRLTCRTMNVWAGSHGILECRLLRVK